MRWLTVVLLLTGCVTAAPPAPQAACEREAQDDPVVRDMRMKAAGSPSYLAEEQDTFRNAVQDATLRCLRARGDHPRGRGGAGKAAVVIQRASRSRTCRRGRPSRACRR